jgi:protein-arginine kinase activator protein McsA
VKCEHCQKNEAVIEFNCLLPSYGIVCEALVCIECLGGNDMQMAAILMKRRAERRKVELPIKNLDVLTSLAKPDHKL